MGDTLAINGGPAAVLETGDVFDWPIITEEDEDAVLEVLRRGAMSGTDVTRAFEAEYADWQGREHALGYNNGTASLLGAMYGVGVGPGDEVIAPALTFWASVLPCFDLGATPVFADIDPDTLCLDPASVAERIGEHTAAVVAVHLHGHPADMDAITDIADEHGVPVIEDVSHAHGARYEGEMVGTIGDVAAVSLMSGKPLALGEAGVLATDDREVYERALALGHYRRHDEIQDPGLSQFAGLPFGGYKHRMHQLSAALGHVQLRRYDERMDEIQRAMDRFWELLEGVPGVHPHRVEHPESTMGGWYLPRGHYRPGELGGLSVERFAEAVEAEGSACDPGGYPPLHTHPLLREADVYGHGEPTRVAFARRDVREAEGALPVAERFDERVVGVPWFKHDRPEIIERHAAAYRKVARHHGAVPADAAD